MRDIKATRNTKYWFTHLGLSALFSIVAYGCGYSDVSQGLNQTPGQATPTPISQMTPTLTGPELDGTKLSGSATVDAPRHAMETQVAEGTPGPAPALIPLSPRVTSVWRPTLGITGECAQGNHQFNYGGCWAGIVNGEYLFVETGAFWDDPLHVAVRVYTSTLDLYEPGAKQVYVIPSAGGRLHPTQMDWPVLTMVTLDADHPAYFAFNLVTREWVSATPSPLH